MIQKVCISPVCTEAIAKGLQILVYKMKHNCINSTLSAPVAGSEQLQTATASNVSVMISTSRFQSQLPSSYYEQCDHLCTLPQHS